jgi:multidrug efflux pump subunit AcrA (membrane-fusion protein)
VALSVAVRVGDTVRQGETLATLYHAQSEEAAAALRIEAKKADIDATIAKNAVANLKKFAEVYNTKLKNTLDTSQQTLTDATATFLDKTLTNAPSTQSYATEIQKTLEQDMRELTEKLTSKNAQAPLGSFNFYARYGVAAGNSQVFNTFASLLDRLTFTGGIVTAYDEAQKAYSAALPVLNSSISTDTFPQTTIDELRNKILARLANLADRYSTINQTLLDSVKVQYDAEVAKTTTNLDTQKTLLAAEREIAQNELDIQKLEAQATLYPSAYAAGLGGVLYTTLTAPFDGVVVEVPTVSGAFVSAGGYVVTVLGGGGTQTVRVEIDTDIEVKTGDTVYVYDPELPFQKVPACVSGLGSAVTSTGLLSLEATLPKTSALFANDIVRVRIPTHEHGVHIPLTTVVTEDEKVYVWKVVDGVLNKTQVSLGSITDRDVEVFSGVRVGDTLASAPQVTFVQGQTIDILTPASTPAAGASDGHDHEH